MSNSAFTGQLARRPGLILLALIAFAFAIADAKAAIAADVLSIKQLMEQKERWPEYAKAQTPMKIEGRFSTFSSRLLRFLKCGDLDFVWHEEDRPFPIDPATIRSRTIEIFGRFELRSGKPAFVVEGVQQVPSDMDKLERRKIALADAPFEQWYLLGDRTRERGAFYNDVALQQEAKRVYSEAVRREQRQLTDDAVDAKIALSKRYSKYEMSEESRLEFLHETFYRRWRSLEGRIAGGREPNEMSDLERLTDLMNSSLHGCKAPLDPREKELATRYGHDPLRLYAASSAKTRLRLNRILYSEIRVAFLQAWAKKQSRDGVQLADRIDREVPEYHAMAEKLRDKALDERLAHVEIASRDELRDLAERFTKRGQREKALQAKTVWVKAKEESLRKEGRAADLVQAAHEYRSLLNDDKTAVKLLIEAAQKAPGMKDVSDQLRDLGWTQVTGQWMTHEQAAKLPPDPSRQAAEAGRFVGLSRKQIRSTLGAPESVTRVISAESVSEVWIYGAAEKSRIVVHFVGSLDGHDVKVVRMFQ